ncbi:aspartic peptidase domain-containing protein [Mycena rosella]|uniref:Aspartic peptidase domain-containing protein n=1 Tax=Mycena rosella TaxID=1033263 RepID=A0AAD7DR66_MYCRO|nr:aspartic peptidase domain-containing protein [Mycena rosella]
MVTSRNRKRQHSKWKWKGGGEILELAFLAISNLGQNPFFVTAHTDRGVKVNQFSFYLASTGSELYLGGTNKNLYLGDINFNGVQSASGFWVATGAKVKVGTTAAVTGLWTIIDSGTTHIYGPPAAVKKLFAKVCISTWSGSGRSIRNSAFQQTCP